MSVFRIDVPKTIQAICLLLKAMKTDRLEYISILKILYIADRESLAERGAPITGDVPVAMKNGPSSAPLDSLAQGEPVFAGKTAEVLAGPLHQVVGLLDHGQLFGWHRDTAAAQTKARRGLRAVAGLPDPPGQRFLWPLTRW
jgi:hypothetical protein